MRVKLGLKLRIVCVSSSPLSSGLEQKSTLANGALPQRGVLTTLRSYTDRVTMRVYTPGRCPWPWSCYSSSPCWDGGQWWGWCSCQTHYEWSPEWGDPSRCRSLLWLRPVSGSGNTPQRWHAMIKTDFFTCCNMKLCNITYAKEPLHTRICAMLMHNACSSSGHRWVAVLTHNRHTPTLLWYERSCCFLMIKRRRV